jgi:hypothetical protein
MTRKRTLWIGCLICLLFLTIAAHAYVLKTIATYSGACGKLSGFPGVLQQTGFMPHGDCKVDPVNGCSSQSCEVNGRAGHCVQLRWKDEDDKQDDQGDKGDKKVLCICKPNRPSR